MDAPKGIHMMSLAKVGALPTNTAFPQTQKEHQCPTYVSLVVVRTSPRNPHG